MGKKRDRHEEGEDAGSSATRPAKKVKIDKKQQETVEKAVDSQEKEDAEKALKAEEAKRLQVLVAAFSDKQLDQYEIFRRATFPKSSIRKLVQSTCGGTVSQNVVIAMSGMAKVHVGQIIEEACQSRDQLGETGPLQPKHIREAVRKLRQKNIMINGRHKKIFNFR